MKEEKIYCVYQHIRPDKNQVFYVGIGSKNRPYDKAGRNKYWYNIVSLNSNYEINVLFENLSWKECCKKERKFIKLYGRKDLGFGTLCNLTDGGEGIVGYKHTSDALDKISKSSKFRTRKKGIKLKYSVGGKESLIKALKNRIRTSETRIKTSNSLLGHKVSEETRKKISEANSNISNETRMKMSKAKLNISLDTRKKLSEAKLGKKLSIETRLKMSRKIIQLSLDNIFIKEWNSIVEASFFYNRNGIGRVCYNLQDSFKGYKWKFKKDYENNKC